MAPDRIAIVGIGLRYPDADSPAEFWENVLAGRQAFRRLPDERMNRADYWSADPGAPDRFYADRAAVLRDWEFDRARYRVAGSTYRATDLTHWLALDVASQALADAGYPDGEGLPRAATGVVLGNTLTGEFSRANVMRLRWPYVRRTVAAALAGRGWDDRDAAEFLADLEGQYKSPFPAMDEDSLAGGLANTIAGRICNHFDLGGGGYTVDGACSSSLLSVVTAANALVNRDVDVMLAGGVDLSIDPFEVVGFAKTGALASRRMKVYDRDSNGFWPGEGCGVLVLMREPDARERGARVYATIPGWGVSSDGRGGITRPEADGHRRALARAYRRAGYGIETVSYFEGHGTGTAVGDATEIAALSGARRDADPTAPPAVLSTIKGNIGHTKAAAGAAGLIKAALAVHHQVIPPATGHHDPHPSLLDDRPALHVPADAAPFPPGRPVRVGVSALGFGGIDAHVTIASPDGTLRRDTVDERARALVASRQDAELLLFDGDDRADLRRGVGQAHELAARLSYAELGDLAGTLAGRLAGRRARAAVVVTDPADAERALGRLLQRLDAGDERVVAAGPGVYLGDATTAPRIAYAFPGQGSGRSGGGALGRRFPAVEDLYRAARVSRDRDPTATQVAQPRIVTGSLAGLRILRALGIEADVAVGHSLGELTALHWGGALGEAEVLSLAKTRGEVMATAGRGGGAMAGLAVAPATAVQLLQGEAEVVVAGYNAPEQTVISGPEDAVDRVCEKARAEGLTATRLRVSHAFHSPLVGAAAVAMRGHLAGTAFSPVVRPVVSTVTGDRLAADADLAALLADQIRRPVRFHEAATRAVADADLVVEVGPGRVLSGLVREIDPGRAVLSLDTDSPSLVPLLQVAAAAHVTGVAIRTETLTAGRVLRPLPLDGSFRFLASPCETAPALDPALLVPDTAAGRRRPGRPSHETAGEGRGGAGDAPDGTAPAALEPTTLELVRQRVAERVELPVETIGPDTHPLDDLHLSSITVAQIVNEVTTELGLPPLAAGTGFATLRLGELAGVVDAAADAAPAGAGQSTEVAGVAAWVRSFTVDAVAAPPPPQPPAALPGPPWQVVAPPGHVLAEPLRVALESGGIGPGVLLCLPDAGGPACTSLLVAAARAVLAAPEGARLVVVQHRLGASGLARTVHLETGRPVTVVSLPDAEPTEADAVETAVARVVAEAAATGGFSEAAYDDAGRRTVPVLRVHRPEGSRPEGSRPDAAGGVAAPLGTSDVVLVTGGGKGITAECALAMATDSAASLGLLGRADPATDAELAANLARMSAAGVRYRYERADVTVPEQVAVATRRLEQELGPVTAVLHGAGRNEPLALADLTEDAMAATLAPKVAGLCAVLAAVDLQRLRLLVTFGSIIGRAGLPGEAHYATANDWLTELTVEVAAEHPHVRALALEWSVWSGAGMGERLGVVEALRRSGITPVSADAGVAALREVLADPGAGPVLVISGRTGSLPTLALERHDVPLRRFADRVLVHYPGVELVTEVTLSARDDPYLADHVLDGGLLFPAVLGMEAMAQVAGAVSGHGGPPVMEDVEFLRPIVVPPDGATTLRVAALVTGADTVDVALHSAETGFGADHFRARLRYSCPQLPGASPAEAPQSWHGAADGLPAVPLDPAAELYGDVAFQGLRFRRVRSYLRASARHAVAELTTTAPAPWFSPFLPPDLVLADPGTRDGVMHALQCCVPDATLLPEGVTRLHLADPGRVAGDDHVIMEGRERSQDGDGYVYDVDVRTPGGALVERWEGLRLRAVRRRGGAGPWSPALLGPHLERTLETVLGGTRAVAVEPDPPGANGSRRRESTELAAGRALGRPVRVRHRPDGRPEVDGAVMSASHGAGLTLVVAGEGPLACDVEAVVDRPEEVWAGLLGAGLLPVRDLVMSQAGDDRASAGTRVWTALECLRKAGVTGEALRLERAGPDGWVVLTAGDAHVAGWVTTVRGRPERVVVSVLRGR